MSDLPASWITAVAVAIGDGTAEPADFQAAFRVLRALRREGALRRLDPPRDGHVYECCGKVGRISRHESWCGITNKGGDA